MIGKHFVTNFGIKSASAAAHIVKQIRAEDGERALASKI